MRRLVLVFALLLAATAHAQDTRRPAEGLPAAPGPPAVPADTAFASLITVWPGEPSYARFGHTAIRLHRPDVGDDLLFNYGTFRFDAFFVPRFLYGALDYELSVADTRLAVESYRDVERRGVVEQRLRLTPAQLAELERFLVWNAQPENAAYRYRFLDDNCTTRARDALERALGRQIPGTSAERASFRDHLDPYQTGAPLLHLGTSLGLGARVDRDASPRQAQFLPDRLFEDVDAARVDGQPLVTRTDTLVALPRPEAAAFPWPAVLLGLLGAAMLWQTVRTRGAAVVTRLDRWTLGAAGAAGLLLGFLVALSLHDVTRPNGNLLWAFPGHLVYALRAAKGGRWTRPYALAGAAAAGLFTLAAPLLPQAIPLAVLPLTAALAVRLAAHAGLLARAGARRTAPAA